jgi:hypothetical protein
MPDDDRASSQPSFWDPRYAAHDHLFGTAPNAFVAAEAHRLPPNSAVVELGAGEGRTLAWLCAAHGHRGTAVDFSRTALAQAAAWAEREELPLRTVEADVRSWQPGRQWDAVIVAFLQLLPAERPALYRLMRTLVRPGGWILGEWFRPTHLADEAYDRIGPSRADRMVPPGEVREAFAAEEIHRCAADDVVLEEGELLKGRAAVVRLVARRRPASDAPPPSS